MAEKRARIAVLVSGGGTNLAAILRAQNRGEIKSGEVVLVVSNKKSAYALERAKKAGIPAVFLSKKQSGGQIGFEKALLSLLREYQIDLIVLAGFLSILSAGFTSCFPERILNIHPSLIPSFCGEGYYGLKVHEEVLKKGVKVTGATVHFVNEIPDGGKILLQKAVKVLPNDTPEILQQRVMRQAEWKLLPAAVEMVSAQIQAEKSEN